MNCWSYMNYLSFNNQNVVHVFKTSLSAPRRNKAYTFLARKFVCGTQQYLFKIYKNYKTATAY